MPPELPYPLRAGFWRRLIAFNVDMLIGGAVIALFGTLAFSLSGGRVQTSPFAVVTESCIGTTDIPADLVPPPPNDSNYASVCTFGSLPGLPMARELVVGREITSPGSEVKTGVSYPLASDGLRIGVFDASWIGQIGVLVYLAAALYLYGKTVGMRLLRIRMVRVSDPERNGVPLRSVLIRAAVAFGGAIPAIVLGIVAIVWTLRDPDGAPIFTLAVLTFIAAAVWIGWNAILIGRKRDPVYDRVAGLAVVRVEARS